MIVVDTSALMAIVKRESAYESCSAVLEAETEILVSSGTLAEALIVAERRDLGLQVVALVEDLGIEIVSVTTAAARRVAAAYAQWGKGVHPASLNFGDCFAYALARERNCPLLYVGNDFVKTDIESAL